MGKLHVEPFREPCKDVPWQEVAALELDEIVDFQWYRIFIYPVIKAYDLEMFLLHAGFAGELLLVIASLDSATIVPVLAAMPPAAVTDMNPSITHR
jgi:hypothetical protein